MKIITLRKMMEYRMKNINNKIVLKILRKKKKFKKIKKIKFRMKKRKALKIV